MTVPVSTHEAAVPVPDGPDIPVFVARPTVADRQRSLVVVPENPGITEWRQGETARMAAELGWNVIVMNQYSRIGGKPPAGPFDSPDERRRAAFLAMPDAQVAADLDRTLAWVTAEGYESAGPPAVLGFCSGGGQLIYALAEGSRVARCAVTIYGNIVLRAELTADGEPLSRIDMATRIDCPLQMHFGSLDTEIAQEHIDEFEAALATTGQPYEIHRYEGADHIFTDGTHPNYNPEATALVWPRVYRFLREHS